MAAAKKASGTAKKTATAAPKTVSKASSSSRAAPAAKVNARKGKGKRKAEEPPSSSAAAAKMRKLDSSERASKSGKAASGRAAAKPKTVINHRATETMEVYVFGSGDSGVLGLGPKCSTDDVARPRLNPNLSRSTVGVVQIATGGMHCVALTDDNRILTWGVNDHGALGRDTEWSGGWVDMKAGNDAAGSEDSEMELNPKESTPTAIDDASYPDGTIFTQIAAGDSATFALTDEGLVYGWGTFKVRLQTSH